MISTVESELMEGPLAQRLEQRTHNPLVLGSNPRGPTKMGGSLGRLRLRARTPVKRFNLHLSIQMGIVQSRRSVRARSLALFCLTGLLCLSVVHSGHFYLTDVSRGQAEFWAALGGDSLCPACIAIHSSVAEPPFHPSSSTEVVHSQFVRNYESPLASPNFFWLFVRPPPSA